MLFNSFLFILLLPIGATVHWLLKSRAPRSVSQGWLLLLSISFYAYGAPRQLPLLLTSIVFNWFVSQRLAPGALPETPRKRLLVGSLAANILLLSFFKYIKFALNIVRAHLRRPVRPAPLGPAARHQLHYVESGDVSRGHL